MTNSNIWRISHSQDGIMWPRCGASRTKSFENEGLRIVTRGMQELIAQRNRKKISRPLIMHQGMRINHYTRSIQRPQCGSEDASSDMVYYSLGDSQPSHCSLHVSHGRIKSTAPGASTGTGTSRHMASINDPRSQCRVSHTQCST
jgi:hypothetical protein